ncbi:LysE family translocator [Thaumasiovibrio sp. DFM-14]|uniref:LysE family translocator n=1 Tax=Thaumasiovibrio sp. DFM-14 TaxID=3384792 RepID=UPI0039A1AB4C
MELSHLLGLTMFAIVAAGSPGPNNIMLLTSGANVGFKRTLPHISGIVIGFAAMLLIIGVGIMKLFASYPMLQQMMQVGCMIYLVYLAYKIASAQTGVEEKIAYRPMTLLAAANFQWVNPKAWTMALTAISLYSVNSTLSSISMIALVFAIVTLPCVCFWTLAGTKLQRFLSTPRRLRGFNVAMAGLLLSSLLPMLSEVI